MRKLTGVTTNNDAQVRRSRQSVLARYMAIGFAAAAISSAMPSCSSNNGDDVIHVPPAPDAGMSDGTMGGSDGGRCINPSPVCQEIAIANRQLNVGDGLVVDGYQFKLTDTGEANGNQWARFDILDACGNVLAADQMVVREVPQTFHIDGTNIDIRLAASTITVLSPKTATFNATVTCESTTDGGVDGGTGGDGGAPGIDAGMGDGGTMNDGGSSGDGGTMNDGGSMGDGGTLGDGGTMNDGGALGDGGSVSDGGSGDGGSMMDAGSEGGVMDAGPMDAGSEGGMSDAGPVDGGPTDAGSVMDSGSEGGVSDAGSMDAGSVDGGSGVCPGLVNDTRTGVWFLNADTPIGASGVNGRYIGQTSTQCVFEFRCIATGDSVIITGADLVISMPDTVGLGSTGKRVNSGLSGKNGAACNGTLTIANF